MGITFNRTTMELKRGHAPPLMIEGPSFNRTTMELKPRIPREARPLQVAF